MATTRTAERPATGRTVLVELPHAVAARYAQQPPSPSRDEQTLIIACQEAIDPTDEHATLIALAREEVSLDRRPSVRAVEDEHTKAIHAARRQLDQAGITWRTQTSTQGEHQ